MRRTVVLLPILLAAGTTGALAQQPSRAEPSAVTNEEVSAVCAEIVGKRTGHPVRDCMASIDMFLSRHNVPRKDP